MKTLAAVLVETGRPLELAELSIPILKPGQVLVEIAWSGVCHTQVLECRGYRGEDRFLPHCLGHEGSGVVVEVGAGVTKVKSGDHVITSWIKGSGADVPSTVYDWSGRKVNAGGITTFSRHAVISENRLTVLPESFPLKSAAMIGCAVPTGVGVIFNTAQARPGQSAAVFGAGGIGLCAIAAAAISGCVPVIAVDVQPEKLKLAAELGATHFINSSEADAVAEIKRVSPNGVDFAVEATGRPQVMQQALESARSQGGLAVVVGNARFGERLELDPQQLNQGKRLLGTWGGDNWPDRDYPRYCKLIESGKLNIEPLMTKTYPLSQINEAVDDLAQGRAARPLIEMKSI